MSVAARILVVEDNAANLELMTYLLDARGYATMVAADGDEGLRIALRENPDLILCDVQMPVLDGYAFAMRAKADPTLRRIPLVAVTALAMAGDEEKARSAGFDGYLRKPIDPEVFSEHVGSYLPETLRRAARAVSMPDTPSPSRSEGNGRTILVLDNVQANLDLSSTLLAYAGYAVVTALDAKQAFALALAAPPDLILSDVCMPEASGYDFIGRVKAVPELRDIPFVFVTSTAMTETDRARGLALGAVRYLFRPIEPRELLLEIEACFGLRAEA